MWGRSDDYFSDFRDVSSDGLGDRPADNADVVGVGELLGGGVGVQGVHVVDGAPGRWQVRGER